MKLVALVIRTRQVKMFSKLAYIILLRFLSNLFLKYLNNLNILFLFSFLAMFIRLSICDDVPDPEVITESEPVRPTADDFDFLS